MEAKRRLEGKERGLERPWRSDAGYSPSNSESFARSKPTTTSSPTTVTGVVIVPMETSSAIAPSSSQMFLTANTTPLWRRNSSVRSQNSHPGFCEYTTTSCCDAIPCSSPARIFSRPRLPLALRAYANPNCCAGSSAVACSCEGGEGRGVHWPPYSRGVTVSDSMRQRMCGPAKRA